jgi:hypothetical protein
MPVDVSGSVVAMEAKFLDGLVRQDRDLSIKIEPYRWEIDGSYGLYAGVTNESVTDNDTNYVYMDSAGLLVVNVSGWPGTIHLRLARVITSGGQITAIHDERVIVNTAAAAAPGVSKTLFIPADHDANLGDYRVRSVPGTGAHRFNVMFPTDLTTLNECKLVGIPSAAAAGSGKDIDLLSDYGAIGELYNQHSESDTTTTYDFTGKTDKLVQIDLMPVLSAVAAGDLAGIQVDHNSIGGSMFYLGIVMRYTP